MRGNDGLVVETGGRGILLLLLWNVAHASARVFARVLTVA